MTMKNEDPALNTLGEMIWDCLNDENITHQELVRTIRSSLGESVAWHKQSADKAQNALNDLNELPTGNTIVDRDNDAFHWLRPGGAGSRDYVETPSWYGDNGSYYDYHTFANPGTVTFTGATKDDTITLG